MKFALTQKQRADIFKELYEMYKDRFYDNEDLPLGEVCMGEFDFGEKLQTFIKKNLDEFDD